MTPLIKRQLMQAFREARALLDRKHGKRNHALHQQVETYLVQVVHRLWPRILKAAEFRIRLDMHSKRDRRPIVYMPFDSVTMDLVRSSGGVVVVASFTVERSHKPQINTSQRATFSGVGPPSIPLIRAEAQGKSVLVDIECNEAWEGRRQHAANERGGGRDQPSLGEDPPMAMAAWDGGV